MDLGTIPRKQNQIPLKAHLLSPDTELMRSWLELLQTSDCSLLPLPEQKSVAAIMSLSHHCVLGVYKAA